MFLQAPPKPAVSLASAINVSSTLSVGATPERGSPGFFFWGCVVGGQLGDLARKGRKREPFASRVPLKSNTLRSILRGELTSCNWQWWDRDEGTCLIHFRLFRPDIGTGSQCGLLGPGALHWHLLDCYWVGSREIKGFPLNPQKAALFAEGPTATKFRLSLRGWHLNRPEISIVSDRGWDWAGERLEGLHPGQCYGGVTQKGCRCPYIQLLILGGGGMTAFWAELRPTGA